MKMEKEITVLVKCSYNELHDDLISKGFKIIEEYQLDDIYLIPNEVDVNTEHIFDLLKKCVLVRKIGDFTKVLTYKYKKYSDNGEIIEQGKTECPITDIDSAIRFMKAINYKEFITIEDKIIVYGNGMINLSVQLVNDKYIFVELEDKNLGKQYSDVTEMISDLRELDIKCDYNNFFVKKAELVFSDTYKT